MPTPSAKPRVLLLDDQPDYPTLVLIPKLELAYDVIYASHADAALEALKQQPGARFDLVILDLMLDHSMPAILAGPEKTVRAALRGGGFHNSYSAQSLGLWLWGQAPRQAYCYISSYPGLYMPGLVQGGSSEFDGADASQLKRLVCERGTEGDPVDFVKQVLAIWQVRGW